MEGGVDATHQVVERFLVGLVCGEVVVDSPVSLLDLFETRLVLVSLISGVDSQTGHDEGGNGEEDKHDGVEHDGSFQSC